MIRIRRGFSATLVALFFIFVFLVFFNGYRQSGPSRSKFKKLPGGTEDISDDEIQPEGEDKLILELEGNRKVAKWLADWRRCMPELSLAAMVDTGEAELGDEQVDIESVKAHRSGPGRMFYVRAPGGGKSINPWWGRLVYKKEESGLQPFIDHPCYALLYDSRKKSARIVLTCSIYEGVQDAIWLDKNRVALLGYESVSRQMDARCKTQETCAAPAIWLLDFSKGWSHSYRGEIVARDICDVQRYLKKRLPRFFGKQ